MKPIVLALLIATVLGCGPVSGSPSGPTPKPTNAGKGQVGYEGNLLPGAWFCLDERACEQLIEAVSPDEVKTVLLQQGRGGPLEEGTRIRIEAVRPGNKLKVKVLTGSSKGVSGFVRTSDVE